MEQIKAYLNEHTNPPVFLISGVVMIALVVLAAVFPTQFSAIANSILSFITNYFGWLYVASTAIFVVFVVFVAVSRFGNLVLGPDDAEPEFDTWSWVSMMFTCGMGIGLVYYGVSEPVMHFKNPPVGDGGTAHAATVAMNWTFFHWGFQPWAVYIVLGLGLGYFAYRRNLPLKPAAAFYPIIGDGIYGPIGHLIDILAVFGTLFGLATSIGLGAHQIAAGLNSLFGIPGHLATELLVILVVEMVAIMSVMLGVDAGIRRLSVINMWLAILLAAFVFVVGPTLYLLSSLMTDTGYYLQHFVETSLTLFTSGHGAKFQKAWTLFYWGWWISWSPFVGLFIARISYGYTIRKFILGTLLIPTGASIVWFVIFGRTALHSVLNGGDKALLSADAPHAIFVVLNQLPVGGIVSIIASVVAIVVVTLFFATSSDSGSLVVDILTNGGDPNPIWQQRLFWAVMEGVVAAVLLTAGTLSGGNALSALQTAAVTTGLPFCIVLLVMCYTLYRSMGQEDIGAAMAATQKAKRERLRMRQSTS
ncbi:BCCT family transporter [Salinisphaera sp. LB1]|uniref:BCCT family transporter n=1 Tax=Salinisphaera sp. LB1 TaxID=2183911 RepID=UPI000D708828|nr:BCCT family transporter [Salinisphaera sp. LB1]AWN15097.1 High-affinity choline uptake protein BetT [Salinisphaera sp. LB1]